MMAAGKRWHHYAVTSVALAALIVAGAGPDAPRAQAQAAARPNVLVIVTDDQRAETLSVMPATRRAFRKGGAMFRNGYATTPLCCPSRASIFTGRYTHNHKIFSGNTSEDTVGVQEFTIQKALKEGGYATALYGKFLNNWDMEKSPPYLDSWSIFAHSSPDGYRGGVWNVDGQQQQIDMYSTRYIGERAKSFIAQQESDDDKPWFLYLAPAAAHSPYHAEEKYKFARVGPWYGNPAVGEADRTDKPPWVQEKNQGYTQASRTRRRQLRTLISVDDMVRTVMRSVAALGEDRETLAFFISDNGYLWSEHGIGTKRYPYLPSVRIPFLMRWPGRVTAGSKEDRIVANIDIAPTIASVADVQLPEPDGRSLFTNEVRTRLLLEFFPKNEVSQIPEWAATITPTYQYTEYYDAEGAVRYREYYDLVNDPWQLHNAYGDEDITNDPVTPTLSLQLQEDRTCAGETCP